MIDSGRPGTSAEPVAVAVDETPSDLPDQAVVTGLDRLSDTDPVSRRPRALLRRFVAPLVAAVTFLAVWQAVVLLRVQPPEVLPGPVPAARELVRLARSGVLAEALWTSGGRAMISFAASVVVGTLLGVLLSQVPVLRIAFGPTVSALQAMPAVAWVPAAIIVFGITDAAIYAVVLIGAVPSVANGLLSGVDHIPPILLRAGHVLGAHGWTLVRHVLFPAAVPGYMAGIRQSWAFAWRSLMAAELIAYSPQLGLGIGQLLERGRSLFDMPLVLVAMLLVLIMGLAVEVLVFGPLERVVLRRRGLLAD